MKWTIINYAMCIKVEWLYLWETFVALIIHTQPQMNATTHKPSSKQ